MTDTPLQRGDIIQDNDPREPGRRLEILAFCYGVKVRVRAAFPGRGRQGETYIRVDRIFLDSKPRKSGWSRVVENYSNAE